MGTVWLEAIDFFSVSVALYGLVSRAVYCLFQYPADPVG